MKRLISILILALTLATALSLTVFAEGAAVPEEASAPNIFDTVYGILIENSDKILSALAFAASLILMLAYKRGLLPILKGALSSLGGAVTRLREEAEKGSAEANAALGLAAKQLEETEAVIAGLAERLAEIEKKLLSAESLKSDSERLEVIMEHQIELLSNVFMSSSLPAYQKEAVGNRISAMKRELAEKKGLAGAVSDDESNNG